MNVKSCLAIDFEMYEKDFSILTEVGLCESRGDAIVNTEHWIIEEHASYRNGKYCPDNRDNFSFGKSKILPLAKALSMLTECIRRSDIIVGQGFASDLDL